MTFGGNFNLHFRILLSRSKYLTRDNNFDFLKVVLNSLIQRTWVNWKYLIQGKLKTLVMAYCEYRVMGKSTGGTRVKAGENF